MHTHTLRLAGLSLALTTILTACDSGSGSGGSRPTVDSSLTVIDMSDPRTALPVTADMNFLMAAIGEDSARDRYLPSSLLRTAVGQTFNTTITYTCQDGGTVKITNLINDDRTGELAALFRDCLSGGTLINGRRELTVTGAQLFSLDEPYAYSTVWDNYRVVAGGVSTTVDGRLEVISSHEQVAPYDEVTTLTTDITFRSSVLSHPVRNESTLRCTEETSDGARCAFTRGRISIGTEQRFSIDSIRHFRQSPWSADAVTRFVPETGSGDEIRLYAFNGAKRVSSFDATGFENQFAFNASNVSVEPVGGNLGQVQIDGIVTRYDKRGRQLLETLVNASRFAAVGPEEPTTLQLVDIDSGATTALSFDSAIRSLKANGGHDEVITGHDGHVIGTYLLAASGYPQYRRDLGVGRIDRVLSDYAFQALRPDGELVEVFYSPGGASVAYVSDDIFFFPGTEAFASLRYADSVASVNGGDVEYATPDLRSNYDGTYYLRSRNSRYTVADAWKFVAALDQNTLVTGDGTLLDPSTPNNDLSDTMVYRGQLQTPAGLRTNDQRLVAAAQHESTDQLLYATAPVFNIPSYRKDSVRVDDPTFYNGATELWLGTAENPATARRISLPLGGNSSPQMPFEVTKIVSGIQPNQFFLEGRWQTRSGHYTTVVLEIDVTAVPG